MKEYINSDNGKVSIDESVVAQVAGLTALDCFGIVGMGIVSVKDGIVKQLRRDNVSKGVNVRFDENGDINPACEEAVMNELRGHFRPEFLNRLDEIIMFKPLTKDNIGNIINLLMNDLNKRLADREITVELSDSARQFIVDHGYDPIYGARPLKRFLQKHVETLSAKLILADEVREGDTILIDTEGDKLTARVK